MLRWLFALVALAVLGALLYLQGGGSDTASTDAVATGEPGFVAIQAQLVETGADGQPLYRLEADRIEQPEPQGTIYLTMPKIDYQPQPGNHWTLTSNQGQLPQDAHSADLEGAVHAEGRPGTSPDLMRIDASQLHLDMQRQIASTATGVTVHWAGSTYSGQGMRADLKNQDLHLENGHGVLAH